MMWFQEADVDAVTALNTVLNAFNKPAPMALTDGSSIDQNHNNNNNVVCSTADQLLLCLVIRCLLLPCLECSRHSSFASAPPPVRFCSAASAAGACHTNAAAQFCIPRTVGRLMAWSLFCLCTSLEMPGRVVEGRWTARALREAADE